MLNPTPPPSRFSNAYGLFFPFANFDRSADGLTILMVSIAFKTVRRRFGGQASPNLSISAQVVSPFAIKRRVLL